MHSKKHLSFTAIRNMIADNFATIKDTRAPNSSNSIVDVMLSGLAISNMTYTQIVKNYCTSIIRIFYNYDLALLCNKFNQMLSEVKFSHTCVINISILGTKIIPNKNNYSCPKTNVFVHSSEQCPKIILT